MADNTVLASGALVVATKGDLQNVQHQEVVNEIVSSAGEPINIGTTNPMPVESTALNELLTAILIELRVQNDVFYAQMASEVEPLELLRAKYKDYPVTL